MFFIDERNIQEALEQPAPDVTEIRDILEKSKEAKGLTFHEAGRLLSCRLPDLEDMLQQAASQVKEQIYGKRVVLFAPLYLTNECVNNCLYCGFRSGNRDLVRRSLTQDEAVEEARFLARSGHKRLLLVCGEHPRLANAASVARIMEAIYSIKSGPDSIRRINVNMAPLDVDGFRELRQAGLGTYQAFQETYHLETYQRMHTAGPKADYQWRLFTMDRAFKAGIEDVGMGVLFGLCDYRFEVLALLEHIRYLEATYGIGCHTLSVPRIEPALGAPAANHPPHAVGDGDFRKLVAVLRLAVPYTGLILSTRERASFRREALALGISQISAASRTFPGAYRASGNDNPREEQFHLGDTRSLDEVIRELAGDGYLPSFCTGCYRSGRTGEHFMELARPGDIHYFCQPNAILTTAEYLLDYASDETCRLAWPLIENQLRILPDAVRPSVSESLEKIRSGIRDLFF